MKLDCSQPSFGKVVESGLDTKFSSASKNWSSPGKLEAIESALLLLSCRGRISR